MSTHLSLDEMKTMVLRHFEEFVNNRIAEVIHQNMTPDFRDHDGPDGSEVGVDEDETMMRRMYELMPDLRVTVEDIVAENDRVVCRNVWRWADGKSGDPMEFHGFVEWRFEGDRIAERWATITQPRRVPRSRA